MANEVRLIDAFSLAEEIESLSITVAGKQARWNDAKHSVLRLIAEQKDINPESLRPKGRWVSVDGTKSCDEWDCTACKQRRTFMFEMELDDMMEFYPYCPNCGAKMEG